MQLRAALRLCILYAVLTVAPLASGTSGSFKVLTYNVAGLPELLSSSKPAENTPYISSRLGPYDIVNVQEDFNYHAALYASNNHPYRTPTSSSIPFGDGLNTLSTFPFTDFRRVTWSDCNLNSGDCLTPKGFSVLRARLSPTQWLDVYNLHADAGGQSGDLIARGKNVAQVLTFISTFSAGMPVLIMGDTNIRYTTAADSVRLFLDAGFKDAWVQNRRGGVPPAKTGVALICPFPFPAGIVQSAMQECEVVDKIFYRSSGSALSSLEALDLTNEHLAFVHPSTGAPLSDHYPLAATIRWSEEGSGLRLSDVVGGPHGEMFSDVPALLMAGATPQLTSLTLAGGNRLDRIVGGYDSIATRSVGGSGGTVASIKFGAGEGVTKVEACQGQKDGKTRVFYMKVTTTTGRTLSAGRATSECVTLNAPPGLMAVGFWGRVDTEIARIGVVWGIVA